MTENSFVFLAITEKKKKNSETKAVFITDFGHNLKWKRLRSKL